MTEPHSQSNGKPSSHSDAKPRPDKAAYWLDEPKNVTKIVYGLVLVCLALLAGDFFYHKHVHFAFEGFWGFYALAGFVSYVFLIFSAKLLRKLVKREEDYYD
jgi:hypothetical protein